MERKSTSQDLKRTKRTKERLILHDSGIRAVMFVLALSEEDYEEYVATWQVEKEDVM